MYNGDRRNNVLNAIKGNNRSYRLGLLGGCLCLDSVDNGKPRKRSSSVVNQRLNPLERREQIAWLMIVIEATFYNNTSLRVDALLPKLVVLAQLATSAVRSHSY